MTKTIHTSRIGFVSVGALMALAFVVSATTHKAHAAISSQLDTNRDAQNASDARDLQHLKDRLQDLQDRKDLQDLQSRSDLQVQDRKDLGKDLQDVQNRLQDLHDRKDLQDLQDRQDLQGARDAQDLRDRKDLQDRQNLRDRFKKDVEVERDTVKAKIDIARDALKDQLRHIQDMRKRDAAERIANNVHPLNGKVIDHAISVLNKISEILDSIILRTNHLEAQGVNVARIRAAIVQAEATIASARAAIVAQVAKVYPVTITTDDHLRTDLENVRDRLHEDLALMRKAVIAAHEAVRAAAKALAL